MVHRVDLRSAPVRLRRPSAGTAGNNVGLSRNSGRAVRSVQRALPRSRHLSVASPIPSAGDHRCPSTGFQHRSTGCGQLPLPRCLRHPGRHAVRMSLCCGPNFQGDSNERPSRPPAPLLLLNIFILGCANSPVEVAREWSGDPASSFSNGPETPGPVVFRGIDEFGVFFIPDDRAGLTAYIGVEEPVSVFWQLRAADHHHTHGASRTPQADRRARVAHQGRRAADGTRRFVHRGFLRRHADRRPGSSRRAPSGSASSTGSLSYRIQTSSRATDTTRRAPSLSFRGEPRG